ncbi:MAG: Bax inhibitor-1/YccA family protein [Rickettsiaceae bacterium]
MLDFNYTSTITGARKGYDEGLRQYLLKIYNYMALGLVVTAVMAFATIAFPPLANLMFQVDRGYLVGITGFGKLISFSPLFIGLYFFMGFGKMSVDNAKVLFWVYSALTGMSLSSLGLIYTGESIARTFCICSAMFGGMSIYGYTTKRDLTSFGSFFVMGLIGLIMASVVNIFLKSSAIYFATSVLGVIIFLGLIAWDTQKIKSIYYSSGGGELGQKMSVMGAFILYLDFINLFLYLLRFFGTRRD